MDLGFVVQVSHINLLIYKNILIGLNLYINSHLGHLNRNLSQGKLDFSGLDLSANLGINLTYRKLDTSRALPLSS